MLSSVHEPLLASLSASIRTSAMSDEGQGTVSYPNLGRTDPNATRMGVLASMFSTAADPRATEVNRRRIYQFWKEHGGEDDDE